MALNMRLYRSVINFKDRKFLAPSSSVMVRSNILNHPYVPLLIDVDGQLAKSRNLEPFYTAPPRPNTDDPYTSGNYWMPSDRHGSKTNVAFIGGHVLSSKKPEKEHWNWDYQVKVGR